MTGIVKCPACDTKQPMDMRIDSFIFGGFNARCECSKCGYKGMWSGVKLYREDAKRAAVEKVDKVAKRNGQ